MTIKEMVKELGVKLHQGLIAKNLDLPEDKKIEIGTSHTQNGIEFYFSDDRGIDGAYWCYHVTLCGLQVTCTASACIYQITLNSNSYQGQPLDILKFLVSVEEVYDGKKKAVDFKIEDFYKGEARPLVERVVEKPVENPVHKVKSEILDRIIGRITISSEVKP